MSIPFLKNIHSGLAVKTPKVSYIPSQDSVLQNDCWNKFVMEFIDTFAQRVSFIYVWIENYINKYFIFYMDCYSYVY